MLYSADLASFFFEFLIRAEILLSRHKGVPGFPRRAILGVLEEILVFRRNIHLWCIKKSWPPRISTGRSILFYKGISWRQHSYFTMVETLPGLEFPVWDIVLFNSPTCMWYLSLNYHSAYGSGCTQPTTLSHIHGLFNFLSNTSARFLS